VVFLSYRSADFTMPTSLIQYEMLPTTWFYVSAIIILAIFFKFNRFWSVRNFDLVALILLTPGLLLIAGWNDRTGYAWLFCVQGLLAVRLIFDAIMVRRPLLEPNLSPEGLSFSCFFLVFFLIAALAVNRGDQIAINTVRLEQILTARHIHTGAGMNPETLSIPPSEWNYMPPGFRPFLVLTERANLAFAPPCPIRKAITGDTDPVTVEPAMVAPPVATDIIKPTTDPVTVVTPPDTAPSATESASLHPELSTWLIILTLIIAGHLIVVCEFAYIGYRHFGRFLTGIACAALYLFHPYSTQMLGRLDHVIPAALILGSVAMYRRPFFSGLGIGAAAALVWYPLWLIPLWCGFYRQKGWIRFLCGVASALFAFALLLCFSLPEWGTFGEQLTHMAGKTAFMIFTRPEGFWTPDDIFFRMPVLAAFIVVCVGSALIPAHKHLATLISGSALLMLGVQFFQLYQGGLYLSWYLPLLILTIFRPNLEDRTARASVS
jgi:hypothetical protein